MHSTRMVDRSIKSLMSRRDVLNVAISAAVVLGADCALLELFADVAGNSLVTSHNCIAGSLSTVFFTCVVASWLVCCGPHSCSSFFLYCLVLSSNNCLIAFSPCVLASSNVLSHKASGIPCFSNAARHGKAKPRAGSPR